MSDWTLIVAVFWFWYLVEGLKLGRKTRFLLGRRRVQSGPLTAPSPLPAGWTVELADPPFSFSPEGISNVPVGSAGRPAPLPDEAVVWRWEEIRGLAEKDGELYVNGKHFCAVTPLTSLPAMRALIDGARAMTGAEREVWLARRVAGWFRGERPKRERRVLAGRTRALAVGGTAGALAALAVSLYLLGGDSLGLSADAAERLGKIAPAIGCGMLTLHFWLVGAGWWAHRKLLPRRGGARLNLVFSALFVPPQAYRLRHRLGLDYFSRDLHPLAWLAAGTNRETFATYARQALADLAWPLPVRTEESRNELAMAISSWMRREVGAGVRRLLMARGVAEADLMAPPVRDSAQSCAYCPRCGSQFSTDTGRCRYGIELQRFE